jgi:hypothetical protein
MRLVRSFGPSPDTLFFEKANIHLLSRRACHLLVGVHAKRRSVSCADRRAPNSKAVRGGALCRPGARIEANTKSDPQADALKLSSWDGTQLSDESISREGP